MQLVHDYKELERFWKLLAPLKPGQVYLTGIACRYKYMNKEASELFTRKADGVFCRQLVTEHSFIHYKRAISQYELERNWSSSDTQSGREELLPPSSLALYGLINPCDAKAAVKMFMQKMLEASFNVNDEVALNTFAHAKSTLLSCFQSCRGPKSWIDIDVDMPEGDNYSAGVEKVLIPLLKSLPGEVTRHVIRTRGGFHVLVYRDEELESVNLGALANFADNSVKLIDPSTEVKITQGLIPLPGTIQGGRSVHFVDEDQILRGEYTY